MSEKLYFPENINLEAFVSRCYDLSSPVGLGTLHYQPGPLAENYAQAIVQRLQRNVERGATVAADMDYVLGRAVKMAVFREHTTGRLYIDGSGWYGHTKDQLNALIIEFGLTEQ